MSAETSVHVVQEKVDVLPEPSEKTSANVSEYDSAGSYSDAENGKQTTSKHSEDGSQEFSESEGEERVNFEREEGDGQESAPVKKVDDDEDKKNPQYIPKRGTFYEHDDRTADDGDNLDNVDAEKLDKDSKKKVWQDKKERWSHDKFNDNEQSPKTRAELISIYGYDIRNEDGPPRARRRRRYGRGPNKYTRNWEDEDAYGKPVVVRKVTKKPRPRRENETDRDTGTQPENEEGYDEDVVREAKSERVVPVIIDDQEKTSENASTTKTSAVNAIPAERQVTKSQPRVGTGRMAKPKREITDSDYRGFTKSRQYKSSKDEAKVVHKREVRSQGGQNNKSVGVQEIERDMSKMNIQDGNYKASSKHNGQRQGSVPPRLQGEQKGSKRYSSLRQRSLPETATPPFNQHPPYYPNDYNQQGPVVPQQQNIIPANPIHATPAQIAQMPPNLPPIPPQVPVTSTPILQGPPQFAPPFPQPPPAFLQPGVVPAPFIPQQPAPIINYVQSQAQFPQAPYQGFQQQYNPVSQPTDLYQPQGGITYYSAQEQQIAQRIAPLKRPKAAIPIVAPPEHRGRGRSLNQAVDVSNGNDVVAMMNSESDEKYEDAALTVAQ